MPLYAPLNNAIFGETLFGLPPKVNINSTFQITPLGYDGLQVDWTLPSGNWNEMILLRSSFGTPVSVFDADGQVLLDQSNPTNGFSVQYIDTGLRPGKFYYYSLFVFSTDLDEWILAGAAQGLVISDWNFRHTYFTWMPMWYLELDEQLTATQYSNSGPLNRFLELLGYEMDWIRSEIESFFLFTDIEQVSGALLPYLGANYGMTYEPELGMTRSRVLVKNAVFLYKNRGTQNGIEAAASAFTGYGCEVTVGPNQEIQLDDAVADRSIGHWLPANNGTTISLVNPLVYGNIVPQHNQYQPLPSIISADIATTGYLPENNDNVFLLSSASASAWMNLLPSINPPTPRQFGMMVYDTASSSLILFGGQDPNGNYLNDTWSWSGTWTQLSPAVSPPARAAGLFVWDPAVTNAVLYGGNSTGGPLSDTWTFTYSGGTPTWLKKSPTNIPPARYEMSGTYDTALTHVIMFGGNTPGGSLNDTWSWDGTNWILFSAGPATIPSPPARDTPATAYNSDTNQIILFGGALGASGQGSQCLNDTWTWNGGAWTQVITAHAPSPRAGAHMCYDPVNHKTYLFGGSTDNLNDSALRDTWSFNGTDWTQLNPATKPPARFEGSMAFFGTSGGGTSYLFGGDGTNTIALNDVWSFNGTNWTSITTSGTKPSGREDTGMCYDPVHNVMWFFGGYDDMDPGTVNNETWVLSSGNAWTHVTPATSPGARSETQLAYDTVNNTIVMFGGYNHGASNGTTWVAETWIFTPTSATAGNWVKASPATQPAARSEYSMAMDVNTGLVTLFGGRNLNTDFNDTWLWNGTTWSQPIVLPSARYGSAMAYDPTTAKVWLFGGNTINGILMDMWSWNGTAWTPVSPFITPSARYGGPMIYDTSTSRMVLFGGVNAFGVLQNDTWNFQASTLTWSLQSPATSPPARYGDTIAFDTNTSQAALFGGITNSGVVGDMWGWNGTTWAQLSATPYPTPRVSSVMAYYASATNLVLFGGITGSNQVLGDTWTFNTGTATWTQAAPATSPGARAGATMDHDTVLSNVILFGGYSQGLTLYTDTWSWNGTTWTQLTPVHTPPGRYEAQMVWDPASSSIILFGGYVAGNNAISDTWSFSGSPGDWTQLTPATTPPARAMGMIAYDSANSTVVMFGGITTAGAALRDTWVWNGTNWLLQSPATSPPARYNAEMVHDVTTGTIILMGGQDGNGNYLTDIWSWSGTTWSQLPPLTSPLPRASATAVWDANKNVIVLVGGRNASTVLGDTWSWNFAAFGIQITTCNSSNSLTLGIPITQLATPGQVVESAYFYPVPTATPVLQTFIMQLDWYGFNGAFLSSTTGSPVTEQPGTWVRASVVATPPPGAFVYGRTVHSASVSAGDQHLMDAFQSEINSQATPGPTAWDPPRDIKINLLPVRQNLVTNPQGLSGVSPWKITNGTLQSSATMLSPPSVTWPAETMGGFVLTANSSSSMVQSATFPVTGGLVYSYSAYSEPVVTARTILLTATFKDSFGVTLLATAGTFTETVGQFNRGNLVDLDAPPRAATLTISLTVQSPVNNEVHYTGAFLMEPLSYLLPYFDANFNPFTDYAWEGTPNQSISDYYPALQSKLSRLITVMPDYIPIGSTFSLVISQQAASNIAPG